eukprot:351361-Chlamydomonas_euryale.AAC.4
MQGVAPHGLLSNYCQYQPYGMPPSPAGPLASSGPGMVGGMSYSYPGTMYGLPTMLPPSSPGSMFADPLPAGAGNSGAPSIPFPLGVSRALCASKRKNRVMGRAKGKELYTAGMPEEHSPPATVSTCRVHWRSQPRAKTKTNVPAPLQSGQYDHAPGFTGGPASAGTLVCI